MPWRAVMRMLLDRTQMIEKLSKSNFMRRAAQMTVYAMLKSKQIGENSLKEVLKSPTTKRLEENGEQVVNKFHSFAKRFSDELKEGFQDTQTKSGKSKRN